MGLKKQAVPGVLSALSLKFQKAAAWEQEFQLAVKEWLLCSMLICRQSAHTPQRALSAELVRSPKMLLPESITPFPHRSYRC